MKLPFGLDFVSLIVGVLFAMFVLPWLMGLLTRGRTKDA